MVKPDKPDNEAERLLALQAFEILDTPSDDAFDDLLRIAASICDMPMAVVSLIDADRQWFKARIGLEASETSRDLSFCGHALLTPGEVMTVPDAQLDPRFHDNPLVTGPTDVRFYAGAPLVTRDGHALGAICVLDHQPRSLTGDQKAALQALSRQVTHLLELHRIGRQLQHHLRERAWYEDQLVGYQHALETQNADLTEQAQTDPLTRLANRRAFSVQVDAALERGAGFAVAVIDIDHFKTVNDAHGHGTGDELLCIVAQVLRDAAGGRGVVARFGGEEFVWLLPDVALDIARLQCEALRETVKHATQALPVTVSIGLAAASPGDTAQALFLRADAQLYVAKAAGRDRVEVAH